MKVTYKPIEFDVWQFKQIDDFKGLPIWVKQLVLEEDVFYATCGSEWVVAGVGYAQDGDYLLRTADDKLKVVKEHVLEQIYKVVE